MFGGTLGICRSTCLQTEAGDDESFGLKGVSQHRGSLLGHFSFMIVDAT